MADRFRGVRQRKHWHQLGAGVTSFTGNALAILGSFTDSDRDPYTVLRGIGELVIGLKPL